MKFGGSSVAGAERIKRVARRIVRERASGSELVVVVSAMGDTTDELLALAAAVTDEPDPRELDVLLATGEHQSATLVSMALHSLGVPAISLTGPQAGITTDGRYGKARIAGIDPAPRPGRAGRRQGRHRRRVPGHERGRRARASTRPRPRATSTRRRSPRSGAAARTRRPSRWPRG